MTQDADGRLARYSTNPSLMFPLEGYETTGFVGPPRVACREWLLSGGAGSVFTQDLCSYAAVGEQLVEHCQVVAPALLDLDIAACPSSGYSGQLSV